MKILNLSTGTDNNQQILQTHLQNSGFNILNALNNADANSILLNNRDTQMIILDGDFPENELSGFIEFLKANKDFSQIPVILSGIDQENSSVISDLKSASHYILPHFLDHNLQTSMIKSVANDIKEKKQKTGELDALITSLSLIEHCSFKLQTLDEVSEVCTLISKFHPEPEKVYLGLSEMVVNAIEHGNLNIDYNTKSQLLTSGKWVEEINHRLSLPEYASKYVIITLINQKDQLICHIKDEGKGFDWQKFIATNDNNGTISHGRGINLASALSVDRIEYIGNGNEVRLYFGKGG